MLALFFSASGLRATEIQSRTGIVLDIKIASKYIYLKLDEQGEETWLATLKLKVTPGDKIEYLGGDMMKDFHSKTLDRTFDYIRFVTRIRVLNRDNASTDQQMPADKYHGNVSRKEQLVPAPNKGDIARAEGGKTIEELFAERDQLKGKTVILRAEVTKVTRNILGKNWITLQDGTGTAPDDKLTATTSENIHVGGRFIVEGIVRTDVDLGAGYQYKMLLDDARFAPETVSRSEY